MDFGTALAHLKTGKKVTRDGWNGKNQFIFLTEGRTIPNDKQRSFAHFEKDEVTLSSHIDMHDAQGNYVSGWTASNEDLLASDWQVVG